MTFRYWKCLLFLSFPLALWAQKGQELPNILWITTEDISPTLGCYGDTNVYTPHLDQLAAKGILYQNAYATAPVCAVARSAIISGMYSSSMGSQHMRCKGRFPAEFKTYPDYLSAAGYYCTNNVKTDYNLDFDPKAIWDDCSNSAHWRNRKDSTQAFFSIFNFTSTHESRVNDEKRYLTAIEDVERTSLKKADELALPPYYPDVPEVRELWARYHNIITGMDLKVGKILAQLKEDGLDDNTIIIFYSDHGAGLPRHKRWLFDTGIKIPLIVYAPPGLEHLLPYPPGTETDELVSFIDLAPTVLHLAGIPIPENMQGRAFLGKSLNNERKYIYAARDRMDERYDIQRAVRDKRYKYIRYYEEYKPYCQYMNTPEKGDIMKAIRKAASIGTMPEEGRHIIQDQKPGEALYDTWEDPFELNNLMDDPEKAPILKRMRYALAEWSKDTYDTGLIPEPILRDWERNYKAPIYQIMRTQKMPMSSIQQTAIGDLSTNQLLDALQHQNAAIRYWAAIHLQKKTQHRKVIPLLSSALNDDVVLVNIAIARALIGSSQNKLAMEVLVNALKDEKEWNRLNAAIVLDEAGELSREAIPALKTALNDQNKYVVRVANHALNTMLGQHNIVR